MTQLLSRNEFNSLRPLHLNPPAVLTCRVNLLFQFVLQLSMRLSDLSIEGRLLFRQLDCVVDLLLDLHDVLLSN
jgi:hypothetical protein